MMSRMGSGSTPATLTQLRNAGGPEAWFEAQLHPGGIQESPKVADINAWFPDRHDSMATRFAKNQAGTKSAFDYGAEFGHWTLLRRVFSTRTVFENMVDLWSNHFHVPAFTDKAWLGRQEYDTVIRTHALGRFDQMLAAVSLQSSMLLYLDNSKSVRDAPNENQGRELLELHTVGPDSGYTEDMVKDSAKILSGWTVHDPGSFAAYYNADAHTMGAVRVLGFSHPNAAADGRAMTAAYLRYLAHHPSTARTIARKLAVRFVSDNPSEALIADLAQRLPGFRHRHQGHHAGAGGIGRVPGFRGQQGAHAVRRRRRHGPGAQDQPAAATQQDLVRPSDRPHPRGRPALQLAAS